MVHLPREVDAAEKLAHPSFDLDNISQRIGLGCVDHTRVAHLVEKLSDDVILALNLLCDEGRAQELFESVDDAVDELEDDEGLDL